MTTWILIANAAEAELITSDNLRTGELTLLRKLEHPDSRKKASELVSDGPGHYKTDSGMRGSYSSKSDPKEVEAEHFAIELAHELKVGWNQNQYKHLIIVAPAHFYGLMGKHFDSHLPDITHISKDYTRYTLSKLAESLKEHLFT